MTTAQLARALVASSRRASLGTTDERGAPFVSLVAMADDGTGRPLLLLSGLAQHTRNLRRDARAALLVVSEEAATGPMDRARVTLAGVVEFLAGDEAAAAKARFLALNPDAAVYASLPDFTPARLGLDAVSWVGGFARAAALDVAAYLAG